MKGTYKGFEGPNNGGFYTAIIEGQGLPTRFFGCGKKPPTTASGTTVEFEVTEKEVGDKTYYSIKGELKGVAASSSAGSSNSAQGNSPRSNDTNSSIEKQVILKAAVEFVVGSKGDSAQPSDVVKAFQAFLPLIQPQAAPTKPKPQRVEPEDEDQSQAEGLPY